MIPKYEMRSLRPALAARLEHHLGLRAPGQAGGQITSPDEAAAFLASRQLVTLWGGTELPSLQEAVSGELVPKMLLGISPAIGQCAAWTKVLVDSGDFVLAKLFRRRVTFVARPLWPLLVELSAPDPESLWRSGKLSVAGHAIARFLLENGPTSTIELKSALTRQLPILPKSLALGLKELEEMLIIYPRGLDENSTGRDLNTWDLVRRGLGEKRAHQKPSPKPARQAGNASRGRNSTRSSALARLLEVTVQSAGIVDRREQDRWFPRWKSECREPLDKLVEEGKLRRVRDEDASTVFWAELASPLAARSSKHPEAASPLQPPRASQ